MNTCCVDEKIADKYSGKYFGRCKVCGHEKYYLVLFGRLHKKISIRLSSEMSTEDIYIDKSEPNIKLSGEWIDTGRIDYKDDADRSKRVLLCVRRELGRILGHLNKVLRGRFGIDFDCRQPCDRCGFSHVTLKNLVKSTLSIINITLKTTKTVLMNEHGYNKYEVPIEKMEEILRDKEHFDKKEGLDLSKAWFDTGEISYMRMAYFLRGDLAFINKYLSLLVDLERKEIRVVE